MIQGRNYMYTVRYLLMEGHGGYGLDWRDLLRSDGHVVGEEERWSNGSSNAGAPVREHDAEVWADTKSLGEGKRSLPREGLRPCPASFQSVKLGIEYLLKI